MLGKLQGNEKQESTLPSLKEKKLVLATHGEEGSMLHQTSSEVYIKGDKLNTNTPIGWPLVP